MNKKVTILNLVIIFLIGIYLSANAGGLGVNISLPEQGGTFIDVVKENHRWLNSSTWSPLEETDYDSVGWPLVNAIFLIDTRPVAEWADEIDDPEAYRIDWSGIFSCSFTGQANVQSWGEGTVKNAKYDSENNRTTFEFEVGPPLEPGYGFFAIAFLNTQRTPDDDNGTGITNFKMIRPGYTDDTEQSFIDPLLLALVDPPFAAIRFKDFTGTDGCDPDYPGVTEWSDRKLPTDASQKHLPAIGKNCGAAWEYVIELANTVKIDAWINIPVSATTEYITELAKLFKENLNSNLNIYVESSNEVWNTAPGYEQTQYNKDQAKALGIGEFENHGRRTIEIAKIFEEVYGQGSLNTKIRVILCTHAPMLIWWMNPMLEYIQQNIAEPNQYIYAIACQTYFSGGAEAGESIEKILADCRASIDEQINDRQSGRIKWIEKANEFGLVGGFCYYEGGPDHGGGSTINIANRIEAERSPRMAELFKYNNNEGFFKLGGNIAIQFTLTSAYNRYGCWGLTDDINDPDRNYKFNAAKELISAVENVPEKNASEYHLSPNYPNPFNPQTTIPFSLPRAQHIKLEVFNITGKQVKTLIDRHFPHGQHQITWNGTNHLNQKMATGLYFYRLQAGAFTKTRRMILIK